MYYLVGFIILGVLALLAVLGLGKKVLKDFGVNEWIWFAFCALVIGLNFVPLITWGWFSFRIGTAILFLAAFALHFIGGRGLNRVIALILTLIFTGITYGVTRIAAMFGANFWSNVNWVYALIVGLLAFVITRNAKYSFICGVVSMFFASALAAIGTNGYSMEVAFNPAVIAGATGMVLYGLAVMLLPKKPNKLSYYFEVARLDD